MPVRHASTRATSADTAPSRRLTFACPLLCVASHQTPGEENLLVWSRTAVLITFDENGGYFDHVPPYIEDADGPGMRAPALIISPFKANEGINSQP